MENIVKNILKLLTKSKNESNMLKKQHKKEQ